MTVRIEDDEGRAEIHRRQFLRNRQTTRLPILVVLFDGACALN